MRFRYPRQTYPCSSRHDRHESWGKHVYCQKPLTHDVYESRQLRLVSEKKKLVTQMGTQIHSHTAYRTAVKLVQSGAIGKVARFTHGATNLGLRRPGPYAELRARDARLESLARLGQDRPYSNGHYHPANWRRWYDFGCGTMGDMAIHILDPVFTALRLGTPSKVLSTSPEPPKQSYGMKNQTRFTFGASPFTTDGFVLTWSDADDGRYQQMADHGRQRGKDQRLARPRLDVCRRKGICPLPHVAHPILLPQDSFKETEIAKEPDGNHYHLFVDACLGGTPTTAHFGYAGPLTEAVLLGVIANRFPQKELLWNSDLLTITNHSDANR